MTGGFPARGSPAARVEGCVSLTGSRRTSGCLESRLGRSEVGCRRRAAACGLGARRRGSSGEVWARGSGLGAALGRGGANGGGCRGGAGLQWRLRGGVSSPAYQRGGGVLRCGSEDRAKGCTKSSPGICVVLGRSLEEGGVLCSGRSTAASRWRPPGRLWKRRGAWHGKKRASARLEGGGGGRPRRVGASARRINGRDGRESAVGGRRRETEQGVEVEEKGDFAICKNSRDYSVNQR